MRVAHFSPLPPAASGIADYCAELLPHLGRYVAVTLFVAPETPLDDALAEIFPIGEVASFGLWRKEFDVVLYHMGNDAAYHEHIYRAMQETPGVVVLHETDFHHFFREFTVARDDLEAFLRLLESVYGRTDAEHALMQFDAWHRNWYAFPSLSPILANALGAIVHSQYACRQVQRCRPDLPVVIIPHHLSLPAPFDGDVDREAIRRDLGLAGHFVIGSFGFMTEAKRLAVLFRAFTHLRRHHPEAVCCLVGQVSSTVDLAGLIAKVGLPDNAVQITGRVPLDEFLRYMIATDIAVNLRYPTSGETSGSVTRLLGLGVPTIVSDVGAFSELPDDVCAKVPVDAWEEETLVAILEALTVDDELRRAMGANARRHVRAHHTLEGSAQAYATFLERVVAGEVAPVGPPATSPEAEVMSDIGATLAGWGITEHDDSMLQPVAQVMAEFGLSAQE